MTKTTLLKTSLLALAMAFVGTACGGKQTAAETPQPSAPAGQEASLPIAYVRMDSVLSQYTYSLEVQAKLDADASASRTRLQGKAAAVQKAAEDFERRLRINAFVNEEAAKTEQARILKMQEEAASLEQQLSGQLAEKTALMQEDLLKKIQEELKVFNAGRYKLILTNVAVLYADEALDITEPFIKHLNEHYKPEGAKSEPKK